MIRMGCAKKGRGGNDRTQQKNSRSETYGSCKKVCATMRGWPRNDLARVGSMPDPNAGGGGERSLSSW